MEKEQEDSRAEGVCTHYVSHSSPCSEHLVSLSSISSHSVAILASCAIARLPGLTFSFNFSEIPVNGILFFAHSIKETMKKLLHTITPQNDLFMLYDVKCYLIYLGRGTQKRNLKSICQTDTVQLFLTKHACCFWPVLCLHACSCLCAPLYIP